MILLQATGWPFKKPTKMVIHLNAYISCLKYSLIRVLKLFLDYCLVMVVQLRQNKGNPLAIFTKYF